MVALLALVAAACVSGDTTAAEAPDSTTTTAVPRSGSGDLSDPPPGVVDREWRAVLIIDGNDDVVPPVDADLTVRFQGDSITGSAGCNRFEGAAAFEASQLAISSLAITEMACTDVEDWQPMIDVLSAAVRVEVVGSNLIVWAADDRGLFLE